MKWKFALGLFGLFVLGFLIFFFGMPLLVRLGREVEVPNLENLLVDDALDLLRSLNLKGVVKDSVYSSKIEKGRVVSHTPEPGRRVKMGRRIYLTVSKGAERIEVPKVKGLTLEEAEKLLEEAGIINRLVIKVPTKEYEPGIVIETSPAEGELMEKTGKIRIYVSEEAKESFLMPNLIGLSMEEVKRILEKYELVLGEIKYADGPPGMVLLQSPMAGVEVTYGYTVSLVVGEK